MAKVLSLREVNVLTYSNIFSFLKNEKAIHLPIRINKNELIFTVTVLVLSGQPVT